MSPFILLFLGLLLIYIEFYLPGAILGTLGGILLVASLIFFVQEYSQYPLLIIAYFIFLLVSVGILIKWALWRIPRAKQSRSIYLGGDQKGFQASSFDASAIGKIGTVLSDLKPGGYIQVDGKQHQALSMNGYISKGDEVIVVEGDGESLIVRKRNKNGNI